MDESLSDRRLAENEVVFRRLNEQVQKGFKDLKKLAESEGQAAMVTDTDKPLHFYCECSDENCRERIKLKPSMYSKLHKNTSQFVIVPGHQVAAIERVVLTNSRYLVVEKYMAIPKKAHKLNRTDVDNT